MSSLCCGHEVTISRCFDSLFSPLFSFPLRIDQPVLRQPDRQAALALALSSVFLVDSSEDNLILHVIS